MEESKPLISFRGDDGGAMEARFVDLCKVSVFLGFEWFVCFDILFCGDLHGLVIRRMELVWMRVRRCMPWSCTKRASTFSWQPCLQLGVDR